MSIIDKYLSELHSDALMNNYVVRPSPIHGNGVFANQDFKKGDFINTHFKAAYKITDFGKHVNHSSSPNAISKRLSDNSFKTYALKNIAKNDEITLDYTVNQDLEQPQPNWSMNEASGSDTVFGQGTNPKPEDETYLSLLKGTTPLKAKIKIKEIEDEDDKDTVEVDVLGGAKQPNPDLNPSYYGGPKPK
jgi:SET domain-containing protein